MKFQNHPLRAALSCIFLFLFFSCSNDLLDETDSLQAIQYQAKTSQTTTLTPIQDVYLQGSSRYNSSIIRLEENNRTGYLMFDLSKIEGEITSANLEFTISSDPGYGTIEVYLGNTTDWTESNLTSQNKPNPDVFLGSINKSYPLGSKEKISLKVESIDTKKTSLILKHKNGNDLALSSRTTSSSPKLTVTYSSSSTTAPEASKPAAPVVKGYYVTVNGKATNNGLSESNAWSLEHAFKVAKAGDVVYVKAGNYGSLNLRVNGNGTASNPIKFIGYTRTPGDLTSNQGSTFKKGDKLNPFEMPMIKGYSTTSGIGLDTRARNYIHIINFQITDYKIGVLSTGHNALFKNVIVANNGEQNHNRIQGGRGFQIYGDYNVIEDCVSLNSNGEGINLKGSKNSKVLYTSVYSLNQLNPTGYYIAVTHGGTENIIENCVVYRDINADLHQGHGYVLKDLATNNIIRNSVAHNTGIEVNFSGVHSNTFENMSIYGNFSTKRNQYTSCIRIANGAHDNTFRNIKITDSRYAINFIDYNDGYVGPGGDRDQQAGGHNNKFINLTVDKAQNIIGATSTVVGAKATVNNNSFTNCTFKNITGSPIFTYMTMNNTKFSNCVFQNIPNRNLIVTYKGGRFNSSSFLSSTYLNVGFSPK
ncbi:CBM96 family carbohydrate-binding protein [Arenibacter latericius]|uniref:CBM96 family carbohydrate-binding protein n=1 Tax=Arenibacter latericius TaxID=86104 RepID=UPI00040FAA8D|nr:right-handed parallel beta-helix repeat-containing protein [Arenibacter latericius]